MKTYREALDSMQIAGAAYENELLEYAEAYKRRMEHRVLFAQIAGHIRNLFYPHFISYPEDAEFIEALIRLTMSKRVLEVGCFAGFTTLHMIRAVYPDGMVVGVDQQAVLPHYFEHPEIKKCFKFIHGSTPEVLQQLQGSDAFDLVYVDSDHSVEHTEKERRELWNITRPGTVFVFHDCPPRHQPGDPYGSGAIWQYLNGLVSQGVFRGLILPSAHRKDVQDSQGPLYHRDLLPHLGVFIRT